MKQRMLSKGLTVAVIILFLGLVIQPSVAVQPETEIEVEPKDYLFQTIINIANNSDVKNLLEKYKFDFLKVDIDRSIYRKILFNNSRLLHSLLFTKPAVTHNNLNWLYNQGIKIIDIIGEDKALELIEKVKIKDKSVFEELNCIIENDVELSENIGYLAKLNNDLEATGIFSKIHDTVCGILLGISMAFYGIALFIASFFGVFIDIFESMGFNRLVELFQIIGLTACSPFLVIWFIIFLPTAGMCFEFNWYDG